MKTLKLFSILLFAGIVLYGIFAFVLLIPNPIDWSIDARILFVSLFIVTELCLLGACLDFLI